jgi:hypothetical protein
MKHIHSLRNWLIVCLLAPISIFAQTIGDYRAVADGQWNVLTTWERWDGASWLTPTGSQGWPGQLFDVETVTIANGWDVTIAVSVPIAGPTLITNIVVDGLGSRLIKDGAVSLNVINLIVRNNAEIVWALSAQGNNTLNIPAGSSLILQTGGQLINGVQNCSAAQRFIIGNCIYATCGGGAGALYSFAEVNSSGGTISVGAGSNSPVCLNTDILLSATPSGAITGTPTYNWTGPASYTATNVQNPTRANATLAMAGIYTVTINNNLGGDCNLTASSSVNVVVTRLNKWTGAIDSLWSKPGNWSCNAIPVYESDVQIPAVLNNPILDIDYTVGFNMLMYGPEAPTPLDQVNSLIIAPNATLAVDASTNFGGYKVTTRSRSDGTGAIGRIAGAFVSGDDNLVVERFIPETKRRWNLLTIPVSNGTATIRDVWAGGTRPRIGNSIDDGSFYLPDPFDANPGDYVAGDATVITGHRHGNAADANNIGYDWWPELTAPGFGTNIRLSPSSIRPYRHGVSNNSGTGFVSLPAINNGFPGGSLINSTVNSVIPAEQGFMLFTRGDRSVLHDRFNATILRPFGSLKKFTQLATVQPKGIDPLPVLTVVGNPYPSQIDFELLLDGSGNSSVIEPYFWVWDSNLPGALGYGGFRLVTKVGPNWQSVPLVSGATINTNAQIIQSSQAFLVEGTTGGGTLTFVEGSKPLVTNTSGLVPFEIQIDDPAAKPTTIYVNLHRERNGERELVDGALAVIGEGFKHDTSDKLDIRKIESFLGNFRAAFVRDDIRLAVDAIPVPTSTEILDLELGVGNLADGNYALELLSDHSLFNGMSAWLIDRQTGNETEIKFNQQLFHDFTVSTSETGSNNPGRFYIEIRMLNVLPVTFTGLRAFEQQKDVMVNWEVATENNMSHYEVEYSRNGTDFGKGQQVAAQNVSPASYNWLHKDPGAGVHFYRVRAMDVDGKHLLSNIVKVNINNGKAGFKAYPNVVGSSRQVTVEMSAMERGTYTLQITDMSGRVIQSQNIQHNGGSASQVVQLPVMSTGRYNIKLEGQSGRFNEVILKD